MPSRRLKLSVHFSVASAKYSHQEGITASTMIAASQIPIMTSHSETHRWLSSFGRSRDTLASLQPSDLDGQLHSRAHRNTEPKRRQRKAPQVRGHIGRLGRARDHVRGALRLFHPLSDPVGELVQEPRLAAPPGGAGLALAPGTPFRVPVDTLESRARTW